MNRRQFTASFGALSGAAALPFSAMPVAAPLPSAVPAATYSWAKLIVRAQAKADPAMLARHLKLAPNAAHQLFQNLIRDGVLRTPTVTGIAQAAQPLQSSSQTVKAQRALHQQIKAVFEHVPQEADPLVNRNSPALGCDNTSEKDCADARTDEPVQESPQKR